MKTYEFTEDSWFSSNGCSCCPPLLMETYNCINHEVNGSAHSVEDCYRLALEAEGLDLERIRGDDTWPSEEELQQICEDVGIQVVIEFDSLEEYE